MEIIERILRILLKIAPTLLVLATFYCAMSLYFELVDGWKAFRKSRQFLVNKKKILCYVGIILLSIALDLLFFERKLALLSCSAGIGFGILLSVFSVTFAVFIHAIPITLLHFLNSKAKNIDSVTNSGFIIKFNKGSISYDWNEVKSLTLNNMKLSIDFISKKRKLKLDSRCGNYYYFLKNIPKGYPTMNYDFIKEFFNNLTTCPFCGLIAFEDFSWCLHCGCEAKNDIREEQLEIFSTMEKDEKFSDFKINNKVFARDENWKPLVTKQEVLQYSKENYWE